MTAKALLHPGTAFVQSLPYREVALKDMTPLQQQALWEFMYCAGDGSWGQFKSRSDAFKALTDVKFGVGEFDNDDTMRTAFTLSTDADAADHDEPLKWFNDNCFCELQERPEPQPPVIMNWPDCVPECGLFEWGYEWFYAYWVHQPQTQFIRFLDGWDASDDSGRGGQ